MWIFNKEELSPEQIKKWKNEWFSMEEAIRKLAGDGKELKESSFRRYAAEINTDKEFGQIGKPQIKLETPKGKGRPRNLYNRAFIEALRSYATSDSFKKTEEEPIDFFINNDWRIVIEEEFKEVLEGYIKDPKEVNLVADELSRIVGEKVLQKYNAFIGQNRILIHQNRKLQDNIEYYISLYGGVEANANVLHKLENHIKRDILESSELLSRKEAYHTKLSLNVNQNLKRIIDMLENTKINDS